MTVQETYRQGFDALQAGELAAACEAFEAVLEATPRHVGALTYLGVALARRGRYADAEARLTMACELDPVATLPRYNLGRLFQITSRRAEALDCYRTVLRLDRRHAAARRELSALAGAAALDEPLLDAPPSGDLAVWELEPGNALLHGLVLSLACAAPPLLIALAAALLTGFGAWWGPGAMAALLAAGAPLAALLCALALYPSIARRRGPVVIELETAGSLVACRAVDAYAVGRILGPVAVLFALLFLFIGLPALTIIVSFSEATQVGTPGPVERAARELAMALIGTSAVALLPVAGCTFLGTISLAGLYNWLAQRTGGVHFQHRYQQRYSEIRRLQVAASWPTVSLTLLPAAALAGLVLALATAGRPLPQMLAAGVAPLLLAAVGPPLAMVFYNLGAGRFGGLRLALAEE